MKGKILSTVCFLLLHSTFVFSAHAQNTIFTYQGRVTAGGADFTGAGQFKFALVTSTNANHTATATANAPSGGYITGYTVTFGGNGYVSAPVVTVYGGGGSGAAAHANLTGGVVTSISVDNTGNGGYTNAPTVFVAPPPPNISYTTYWSNDGSSVNGTEPGGAASVTVSNGLFTVALGDTTQPNMAAVPSALFDQPNLQLRIWFNDGVHGSVALDPAQSLTPTPYAVYATAASNLVSGLSVQQTSVGAPNVIGGSSANFVASGVVGATMFGGGTTNSLGAGLTNKVTANFATSAVALLIAPALVLPRSAAANTTPAAAVLRRWAAASATSPMATTPRSAGAGATSPAGLSLSPPAILPTLWTMAHSSGRTPLAGLSPRLASTSFASGPAEESGLREICSSPAELRITTSR